MYIAPGCQWRPLQNGRGKHALWVSNSYQVVLELSLALSMSCPSLSYKPSSLSPAETSTTGSSPQASRRYQSKMRSEEMRQARRRLVNVILNQACLSSALGHVAPDSATCRTAASSARSARVAMALRSNRDPLTNLATERLDPIWVRTAKGGRMIDRCTETQCFKDSV